MGTRTNSRRSRRSKRGLASFVSFLLLFAFALGQGGSLFAVADDGTDPVATEEVVADDLSADGSVPVEEAPAEEAPVEEAPAEEAPVEEAPVDDTLVEEASGDSAASATNTASTSRTAPKASQLKTASAGRTGGILSHGGLHGGDISLNFAAAGPFTYNHLTGVGGAWGDGHISKDDGIVESLEGGDFQCGDLVVFFTEVTVDDGADGAGTIELDYSFGAETTGQPGVGFVDIVSVGINTGDSGMTDGGTAATATLDPASEVTVGDELLGTVLVTGLDPGDVIIVRLVVRLGCEFGDPTGNLLNSIEAARVVLPGDDETISVGQQTVPMKQVGDVARPGLNVDKTCPPSAAIGDTITYTISIQNTGNETLDITSVLDTVNAHPADDITDLFPATVAAGATVTRTYQYTVLASDPDPLPNSVSVIASGQISEETLTGSASCVTDIIQAPAIDVTKTCPTFGQVGDTITYTITVKNTGDETLNNVTVVDTLLGNLSGSFADSLAAGVSESHTFPYTVKVTDPDPLPNTVTASGTGARSQQTVTDTASCQTDILNPAIDVTKTCPTFGQVGDTITYTITVKNTGDETLNNVTVVDTLLGDLSGSFADSLAAGVSESHTFPYTVDADDADPLPNTVTASGTGARSTDTVTDTASCQTDILNPAIDVEKTCEPLAHVGDEVSYTITVTNTGDEDLENVTVTDTVLGDLSGSFADTLAVGASESHDFPYTIQADDDDPLPNTVTATGTGVTSGDVVDDVATCVTDIIHPGISIVKTVSEEIVEIGDTVTYTYVVTNTGDTTLYDISVVDDKLGPIGDIPVLEPGFSVTLTKDFVVNEIVINIGTAVGEDILGRRVSASDDAAVTVILPSGENPPNPPNPPTPFTGSDAGQLGLITMVLFGIGVTVVASTRRRRPEREAA